MNDDLTRSIHHYLTHAPSSLFAGQPVEMLNHWQGEGNLLWRVAGRGRAAVVKLFLDAGQARNRRQFDAHTLFAPSGLAPTPLWYDHNPEGVAREINIYTWVEGEAVAAEGGAFHELAHAIARIHTTCSDEVRRFSPHPYNLQYFWRIEQTSIAAVKEWLAQTGLHAFGADYAALTSAASQVADQVLSLWASAASTPVHGDLRLEHALLTPHGICFVDWEMSGLGDPALEIARFLQRSQSLAHPEQLAAWVDTYLAAVNLPGLGQRIAAYNSLLPMQAVTYVLLGLHQYAAPIPPTELLDALPLIADTLAAGLALAAASLSVNLAVAPHDLANRVAAVISN